MDLNLEYKLVIRVFNLFKEDEYVVSITKLTSGNINLSFLLHTNLDGIRTSYILQKISSSFNKIYHKINHNYLTLGQHISCKVNKDPDFKANSIWRFPNLIRRNNSPDFYIEYEGCFWRLISFIDNSLCYQSVTSKTLAYEFGYGLSTFHHLSHDIPLSLLQTPFPDFHNTNIYLSDFQNLLHSKFKCRDSDELSHFLEFVTSKLNHITILDKSRDLNTLSIFPVHSDPKISNFLIDKKLMKVSSLVDLDTFQPGLLAYDLADLCRSCCNIQGEDTLDLINVSFDLPLFESIISGYFSLSHCYFSKDDYEYLPLLIRQITFELGLRFLSDHIRGDLYFSVSYQGQNLRRAGVQFSLVTSIEKQMGLIFDIVKSVRRLNF